MEETGKGKVLEENSFGCLAKKEEYFDCIFGYKKINCFYCDIGFKDCDYWKNRCKNRETNNNDDWKTYLLDRGLK